MFLRRLTIEDIGPIARLDLPFDAEDGARRRTLLLGENGAGKSTLLRALALALAGSAALPALIGDPAAWVRRGQPAGRISVELQVAGRVRAVALELRPGDAAQDVAARAAASLAPLDQALAALPIHGYGAARSHGAAGGGRAGALASLFSADARVTDMDAWAAGAHAAGGDAALATLRAVLDELLPEARLEGFDRQTGRLRFRTSAGPARLDELGGGDRDLAAWAGDLVARSAGAPAGVLLVDALDAQLHPAWQRLLAGALDRALPGAQVVAVAYSALTVHAADAGELYVLRRGEAGATLTPFPGTPRRLLLHQLLLSPLLGIETLDSRPVELLREEYRALRDGPAVLGQSDPEQLGALRRELEDLPDWRADSPRAQRQAALLEDIRRALRPDDGPAG